MHRRLVLKRFALAGASLAHCIGWAQAGPMRTRRNATDPAAAEDLAAFGRAVRRMLQVQDARNPDSWMYWANVHGMPMGQTTPTTLRNIWRTCDHGDYFLAWHRLYLIYFEATVARISGKSDFAMPYWDWFRSANIPPTFGQPADTSNPLYRERRGYQTKYPVSTELLASSDYLDFNDVAFGDPHSPIHLNFTTGEMRAPATAARDPVFWPHHAAMDRLWEAWLSQSGDHTNPSGVAPWSTKVFHFLPDGGAGSRPVSHVLSLSNLGYRYDTMDVPQLEAVASKLPPKPERLEVGVAVRTMPLTESPFPLTPVTEKRKTSLTGEAITIRLPLPPSTSQVLETVGAPQGTGAVLRLQGVKLTAEGARRGVLYNIYVNLPASRSAGPGQGNTVRHRVGQINSFRLGEHGAHEHGESGQRFEFSITKLIPQLKAVGQWDPNMIEIDLVEPSRQISPVPLITIDRVQLLVGRGS